MPWQALLSLIRHQGELINQSCDHLQQCERYCATISPNRCNWLIRWLISAGLWRTDRNHDTFSRNSTGYQYHLIDRYSNTWESKKIHRHHTPQTRMKTFASCAILVALLPMLTGCFGCLPDRPGARTQISTLLNQYPDLIHEIRNGQLGPAYPIIPGQQRPYPLIPNQLPYGQPGQPIPNQFFNPQQPSGLIPSSIYPNQLLNQLNPFRNPNQFNSNPYNIPPYGTVPYQNNIPQ